MAYSINTFSGTGNAETYALSFALGILSRDDVSCRVGNEVDGLGDPVYRTISWITDSLVTISGTIPTVGQNVVFTRTVSKTTLIHDYANGAALEERNLDESNKQALMALQEFIDGRTPGLIGALDLQNNKIINLAAGVLSTDAPNYGQLQATENSAAASAAAAAAYAVQAAAVVAANMYSTGDIKETFKVTADPGWIMAVEGTIGSAASGATIRANPDTVLLYGHFWNTASNTICPVTGGRGASAAADFAANKPLAIPKLPGRIRGCAGTGTGLTARTLYQAVGAETHALIWQENGAHTHTITDRLHSHAHGDSGHQHIAGDTPTNNNVRYGATNTGISANINTQAGVGGIGALTSVSQSNITIGDSYTGITGTNIDGLGQAHNNMQPTVFVNVMVKL